MTKAAAVRVCGLFVPDPELPHEDHQGRRVCLQCHLPGRPGDAHHPDVPGQAEHRRRVGDDGV